ncbi:MAG: formamidopyrimidine-DNA glycosylase [Actinomycetota bacterium]|jgi:formamidopyrimidine-DNA glycosylase|nr:formamidopyrimidine-DNA glycosylase [Actinomycetota bacterium]
MMLALPEIEVLRRDLENEVVGRRIKEVEIRPGTNAMKIIRRHGRRKEFEELLVGAKIEKVRRVGRKLFMDLDNGRVMVFDLATTGRLMKTSASEPVVTHTHIIITFTIGGHLRMVDPQRTGEVFVAEADEVDRLEGIRDFKIDPLEHQVAWQEFSGLLVEREAKMKELLMDETFIVGLGDVYSDEVLFAAGISHDRMSNKLTSQDVRRLYRALMETMQDALKAGGTLALETNTVSPVPPGMFQWELKVFERDGEACRRCRSTIERVDVKGAYVTYYCPQCQS